MLTPAMMASRVSAFCRVIMSYALATPRMPLAEEITIGGPAKLADSSASARASRSRVRPAAAAARSEEHTSELQSRRDLVCRLLLEKKKQQNKSARTI